MPLTAGSRYGPYEILSPLGAGGMGEVYRARDTRLGRDVAIKALPEIFALDRERLARFEREAQLLAALNHPHIAAIYGLEEQASERLLVLELVEGPTLAELLGRSEDRPLHDPRRAGPSGPAIPLDEALRLARQIAEALEAAHGKGMIHRDLKPANIKLTTESQIKILDFGLAKDVAPASASTLSHSPTFTLQATEAGVILGTAACMSPEQARGKPVDKRADIWAFGCVLYELITGKRAFEGETISDTMAAVLRSEPDWRALPAGTPAPVIRLLRRCLEKDPRQRLHDIADARLDIEEAIAPGTATPAVEAPARAAGSRTRRLAPWALVCLLAGAEALTLWRPWTRQQAVASPGAVHFEVHLPKQQLLDALTSFGSVVAVSPDGRDVVYTAKVGDTKQLYRRSLAEFTARAISGTEGGDEPFFAPDGLWLGFFADGSLKKIPLQGGASVTLAAAPNNRGACWGSDGTIIYSPNTASGLWRVPSGGGQAQRITQPDAAKDETDHRYPDLLPDGKAVIVTVKTSRLASFDDARIVAVRLDTGERKTLVEGGTFGRYVPTGHLVYLRGASVMAAPFDARRLEVTGPGTVLFNGGMEHQGLGSGQMAWSQSGVLAFVPGGPWGQPPNALVWSDRRGRVEPATAERRPYFAATISPDGRRLALSILSAYDDIWTLDLDRGTLSRLTFAGSNNDFPIWTPDGRRIVFVSDRHGPYNLYWKPADGSGAEDRLTTADKAQLATSVAPDGQTIAFVQQATGGNDIWLLSLKDRKVRPFLETPFDEETAVFSPDGHWLAYLSNESGHYEVYVAPFPGPGGKWQVSNGGGTFPIWARNGRELFYQSDRGQMAVDVLANATFNAGPPRALFKSPSTDSPALGVSPDGQRFLTIRSDKLDVDITSFRVVIGWFDELRRQVPVK